MPTAFTKAAIAAGSAACLFSGIKVRTKHLLVPVETFHSLAVLFVPAAAAAARRGGGSGDTPTKPSYPACYVSMMPVSVMNMAMADGVPCGRRITHDALLCTATPLVTSSTHHLQARALLDEEEEKQAKLQVARHVAL